jgi:hypothetical protein
VGDPAPFLHSLMSVPVVRRYALNTVVTTVDAVLGVATMDAQPESVKQAAVALQTYSKNNAVRMGLTTNIAANAVNKLGGPMNAATAAANI